MLTPKQRLRTTLERGQVDRPAFVCPGGMMNMAVTDVMDSVGESWPRAHTDAQSMARLVLGMAEAGGIENLGAPFCMTIEAEAMGAGVDLGDRQTEPRVVTYAIESLADIDRVRTFDAENSRAVAAAEATRMLVAERPDLPMIASVTGPISLATSLVEPLVFYRALRRDKAAAHALCELSAQAAMALGDELIDAGADTVCIADPSGTGELIGAKAFDEFSLPYINRIVEHFAARGVPSIVHICGRIEALGTALGRLAAPCISIDSNVSFKTIRTLAPEHLLMGNVSTYLLEYGKAETLRQVAIARVLEGVDVIAPACGIGPRTPVRNIRALADAVASAYEAASADRQTA